MGWSRKNPLNFELAPVAFQVADFAFILWLMIGLPNFWFHGNAPPFFLVGVILGLVEATVLLKLLAFAKKLAAKRPSSGPFQSSPAQRIGIFFLLWACSGLLGRFLVPAVPSYEAIWLGLMTAVMWLMAMRQIKAQSYFPVLPRIAFNVVPIAAVILVGGFWNWSAHGPDSMILNLTEDRLGVRQAQEYATRVGNASIWVGLLLALLVLSLRNLQISRVAGGEKN